MQLVFGDLLGLGHSTSSFGFTLALVITFFIAIGALVNGLVVYIIVQVLAERRENNARIHAYDQAHPEL
ncbi:MAG: hypothetical protein J2O48_05495 [Solirubrobacterales bacterium]|nr:hypothetical protein [Solirubrobacterales bacterium]